MKLQEQARQWREAFDVKSDSDQSSEQYNLQIDLIEEEFKEVLDAFDKADQDKIETQAAILKELADLVFVCYQAAENMGWDLDEALDRIFKSNMSKLDDQGRPIRSATGKVLKGPNYQPPNLTDLVS